MGDIINIEDMRRVAGHRLPKFIMDFVDGGAEDEVTLRANRSAFEKVVFRPRVLGDVSGRDLSTTVLGQRIAFPVMLAPNGINTLVHREGEVAAGRAAVRMGTIMWLSAASGKSLEDVAKAAKEPFWFQLYPWREQVNVGAIVERAKNAGYRAMCVTVDARTGSGKRERDLRNFMTLPPKITGNKLVDVARRPLWLRHYLFSSPMAANLAQDRLKGGAQPQAWWSKLAEGLHNPGLTWDGLAWLRDAWEGPLIVKGIMNAEDARCAVKYGYDGVAVSNHGGRQFDCLPATLDVLPEIVDAVGGKAEVFFDGGIRRGSDVVKAIALGANACLIGRAYIYGLAVDGESGVVNALEILRSEIDRVMGFLGCRTLADIDRKCVDLRR